MNFLPKISIITPSFNSAKYLEEAIQSVLTQEYPNFEHIIIDGGSNDGTIEILKKYPHLIWISEPDKGQSDAMNKGFRLSTGGVIVYLNADDYFLPNAFFTVVPYFINGAKFVVGQVKVLNIDGSFYINNPKVDFFEMLKWWNFNSYCYNPVGYFYKREVQEAVGGFNELSHYSLDVEFLLDSAKKFKFTKVDNILGVYRYFPETKTFKTSSDKEVFEKMVFIEKYYKDLDKTILKDYHHERKEYFNRKNKLLKETYLVNKITEHQKNRNFILFMFYYTYLLTICPNKYFDEFIVKIKRKLGGVRGK